MISETRERFLRAIVGTVPADRIEEIHFFPPIKQGGVESGVAVIAASDPAAVAAEPPGAAPAAAEPEVGDAEPIVQPSDREWFASSGEPEPAAGDEAADDRAVAVAYPVVGPADVAPPEGDDADGGALAGAEPEPAEARVEVSAGAHPEHDHPPHDELADAVDRAEDADEDRLHGAVVAERIVPIAARSAPSMTDEIPTTPVLDDLASGEEDAPDVAAPPRGTEPAARRFTVFTARYRLVLKGIDRGKWEASAVAEADAPLLTVEAVVRGVQRRSGDVDDPERMSGDEVRAELARMEAAAATLRAPGALRAG